MLSDRNLPIFHAFAERSFASRDHEILIEVYPRDSRADIYSCSQSSISGFPTSVQSPFCPFGFGTQVWPAIMHVVERLQCVNVRLQFTKSKLTTSPTVTRELLHPEGQASAPLSSSVAFPVQSAKPPHCVILDTQAAVPLLGCSQSHQEGHSGPESATAETPAAEANKRTTRATETRP